MVTLLKELSMKLPGVKYIKISVITRGMSDATKEELILWRVVFRRRDKNRLDFGR